MLTVASKHAAPGVRKPRTVAGGQRAIARPLQYSFATKALSGVKSDVLQRYPSPTYSSRTSIAGRNVIVKAARGGVGKWAIKDWNVDELIGKNFLFFEAQESGRLPPDHRIQWRGDSYKNDKQGRVRLDGGWFDAGDHLKLMFPMCWTVSHMAWAMAEGKRMLKSAEYDGVSNWDAACHSLEHALEFLLNCYISPGEFVAQVGVKDDDHSHCLRAELDKGITKRTSWTTRYPQRPGGDMLALASAAFAASAVAFEGDNSYNYMHRRCLKTAKDLFRDAMKSKGKIYSDSIPECRKTYPSDGFGAHAFYAAAMLYKASGESRYRKTAEKMMNSDDCKNSKRYWMAHNWANSYFGACLIMYEETGQSRYKEELARFADAHLKKKNGVQHTPKGLTFVDKWGSLRHAAGVAGVLAGYARVLKGNPSYSARIMKFAEHQMCYIMGAAGHSYVVGFGHQPPRNPHHRDSALTYQESDNWHIFKTRRVNANSITGALVGGPDAKDKWQDDRMSYQNNEVAVDYNAAMLFGLVQCAR